MARRARAPAPRPPARHRARAARRAEADARPRPGAARRRGVARRDARGHLGRERRRGHAAALARVRPPARAHEGRGGFDARDTRGPRTRRASRRPRSTRSSATPTRSPAASARSRPRGTASSSRPRAPAPRNACATCSPAKASTRPTATPTPGAVRLVVAPLERGVVLPGAQLALVAEADLTGRRRVHRRARGARQGRRLLRRARAGRLRRALPARRRSVPRDEAAHHGRRRARLPLARVPATAGSTCPPTRSGSCASTPAGRPRRSTAWAAPTSSGSAPECAARCARSPRSSWCCTAGASPRPATRSGPTRRGSTRWRRRSRSRRRPTSCRPSPR